MTAQTCPYCQTTQPGDHLKCDECAADLVPASRVGLRINRVRFPTLDGIPAADWLECRKIERQLG